MYSPFRPFVRGTVILRDLTKHGYSPFTSWDDYPSILCETKAIPTWLSCLRKENQQTTNICVWKLGLHCIHRSNGLKCPTMNPHRNSNHAIHSLHLLSRSRNLLLHLSHLSGSCGNMSAIHVFFFLTVSQEYGTCFSSAIFSRNLPQIWPAVDICLCH